MSANSRPILSRSRLVLVVITAGFLALLVPLAPSATGAKPVTASQIKVTALGTPSIDTPDTAGAPAAFIVRNVDFQVGVTLFAADGVTPTPASTNKPTTLSLSVSVGPPALDPSSTLTTVVPAGATTASFDAVRFTEFVNQVELRVTATQGTKEALAMSPGDTAPFDVLKTFVAAPQNSALVSVGFGGGVGTPCTATPEEPVCADLLLPNAGGVQTDVLMSLGACDETYVECPPERSVVQTLVGLDQTVYTRTSPATLIMKCDKTSCPGGGVSSYTLSVSLSPTGPLEPAEPCAEKGVIDPDLSYCVDYRESQRDNSGDTHLYLLFTEDKRATWP